MSVYNLLANTRNKNSEGSYIYLYLKVYANENYDRVIYDI